MLENFRLFTNIMIAPNLYTRMEKSWGCFFRNINHHITHDLCIMIWRLCKQFMHWIRLATPRPEDVNDAGCGDGPTGTIHHAPTIKNYHELPNIIQPLMTSLGKAYFCSWLRSLLLFWFTTCPHDIFSGCFLMSKTSHSIHGKRHWFRQKKDMQ